MKYYFLLFLLLCGGGCIIAQSSIFDELTVPERGKGTVTIHQSASIRSLVGKQPVDVKIETEGDKSFLVMPGYRIQVFSGNIQRTSMNEALDKKKQIENLFSNVSAYVNYTAPFWRLRVGDYLTIEEAYSMMSKLVEAFPAFKKEIQIMKEEVRIPLN
jgi:hypothetical protein